jgi:predicted amidohydrolase
VTAPHDRALVAVQLEIGHDVLASGDAYRLHIEAAAARAIDRAGPARARLVVFPEIAGHLALYALSPPRARKAKTLSAALAAAAVRRPLDVLRGVASTRLLDARHAVLGALAPDGERFWKSVFGPLARKHEAYIVAGSFLRLHPDGELTNASLLFGPEGRVLATTDKVNLVPGIEDGARGGLGLARGDSNVPTVDTALGTIATLIGYDSFREPYTPHERFVPVPPLLVQRGGVEIVANPAGSTLGQASQWERQGMVGSLRTLSFARYGVTAHLVGQVLDLEFEGTSQIVERTDAEVAVLARAERADRGGSAVCRVS